MGVEVDARPFAQSTLQQFRAQLVLHDKIRDIFRRRLELVKQKDLDRGELSHAGRDRVRRPHMGPRRNCPPTGLAPPRLSATGLGCHDNAARPGGFDAGSGEHSQILRSPG